MARIQVNYDATQEIEQIIKAAEQHIDLKREESEIYSTIQKIIQSAFDEGRRFQKQISISSNVKDSISVKADI
jgi:hypothetical protein